ncbi:hypothetical protein PIIN_06481 [Serendipita indica DSM 11827]|uniref:C2H2-type domain-containing protein n=1 Tax=Serendipita indica (strain DSM 11827) TaxID=1109443 RepID=G4TMK1_SERID|nr:hypothetical protein PIIN_06481 [Serendipita indica DSM 11827]
MAKHSLLLSIFLDVSGNTPHARATGPAYIFESWFVGNDERRGNIPKVQTLKMSRIHTDNIDEVSSGEEDTVTVDIDVTVLAPGNEGLQNILRQLVAYFQRTKTALTYDEVAVCFTDTSSNTRVCTLHKEDGSPCRKPYDRLDRSVYHIQSHLKIRPYHCNGCVNPLWYASRVTNVF